MSFQIYDGCTDLVLDTAWGAIVRTFKITGLVMMLNAHESSRLILQAGSSSSQVLQISTRV
ncbi:hypothetical protein CY34DRAFT_800313 [Suillus luteus UH-Slu-Lm8-n1]|uniref:Uncharacterized protein n=1 Tax=Suillus luteus UH-Slu-Lm8-n1 TaxID=930992 RepID=A0A0D0BKX7_9AGAM|nr:hypothetical protein CY34DRAFT_800313 [Suillus luteus UH-Slu-Lm8-n1]